MRVFPDVAALKSAQGEVLGTSDWLEVTQEQVNQFADATDDHQWIHVDAERAKQGPFGATIAHGFLTLSLLPAIYRRVYRVEGVRMGVNYGLNKVRFPAPVPVGSKVRGTCRLVEVSDVPGGVQVVLGTTVEIDGADKPTCVAESVARYYA